MTTPIVEVDEVEFTVRYDGPAVASGRMDARDLAPAMLSTARLFEHSAAVLLGAGNPVKIEVNADFRRGSFAYEMLVGVGTVGSLLLQNLSASDLIAIGAVLINTVKIARGREPASIERSGDQSTFIFHDGPNITVNGNVANLYVNPTIRRDLDGLVEPLRREGIDTFQLVPPDGPPTTVNKDEVDYFRANDPEEQVLQDQIVEDIVQVVSPVFRPGNKWQFDSVGAGHFWARIVDERFLDRVARHEIAFGNGDALRVRLRVQITRNAATGKFDRLREVVEVVELIPPSPTTQQSLWD